MGDGTRSLATWFRNDSQDCQIDSKLAMEQRERTYRPDEIGRTLGRRWGMQSHHSWINYDTISKMSLAQVNDRARTGKDPSHVTVYYGCRLSERNGRYGSSRIRSSVIYLVYISLAASPRDLRCQPVDPHSINLHQPFCILG